MFLLRIQIAILMMRQMSLATHRSFTCRRHLTSMTMESTRICIVGGGFGGLYTALKANTERKLDITLIDSTDKFVFLPLLYELAVETANVLEVAPLYKDILSKTKIKFIQGIVNEVDLETKLLKISSETNVNLNYDKLVISVGAKPQVHLIPGADKYSLPFYTVEDALKLKKYIRAFRSSFHEKPIVRVAVIGGGYSGVEVATSIAQSLGKDRVVVSLIDRNDKVMHTSPVHNRMTAEKSLRSYGISINCNTSVVEVFPDRVSLRTNEGETFDLQTDLVICTAGMQQSPLVMSLPLPKDESGRLLTDRTLQCKGYPDVFALGDCSAIDGYKLPSTAQVAMQQANIVASNLILLSNASNNASTGNVMSSQLEKFRYVPLGEMLTLGGDYADAAVTSLGGLVRLQGPVAALARRVVYAARMPTTDQAVNALVGAGVGLAGNALSKLIQKNARNRGPE